MRQLAIWAVLALFGPGLAVGAVACTRPPVPADAPGDPDGADGSATPDDDAEVTAAPELERVCAHSYAVLIEPSGAGSPAVRSDFITRCIAGAEQKRVELGEVAWAERERCILAGDNAEALGRCDGREPAAEPPPVHVESGTVDLAQVCEHMIELSLASVGPPGGFSAEELRAFLDSCVSELESTRAENPEKFDVQARCLLTVKDFVEMSRCEE